MPVLTELPPAVVAVLLAAGLLLAALLSYRLWLWLLGPVFAYDTVRIARRGQTVVLRCLYAVALFGTLYFVYPTQSHLPTSDGKHLERFATEFSNAFLIVQAVAVLVLTPIYVAGAIADEKERRSLDFLLITSLRNHEIVVGKLAARLMNLFGLLLAGLPILAITQLWGGVDLVTLLSGFTATACQALSLGAFTMLCSVLAQRTSRAMFAAYAVPLVVTFACLCTPFDYLASPILLQRHFALVDVNAATLRTEDIAKWTAEFAGVHGLAAVLCLVFALRGLRRSAAPPEPLRHPLLSLPIAPTIVAVTPDAAVPPAIPSSADGNPAREPAAVTPLPVLEPLFYLPLPPLGSMNAVLWKETYVGRPVEGEMVRYMLWLCYGVLVLAMGLLSSSLAFSEGSRHEMTNIFFALIVLPAGALLIGVTYRVAGCITREREQRTLESLLALPLSRGAILWAKWRGAVVRSNVSLIVLCLTLVVGVLAGALHPLSGLLLLLALLTHLSFVANLALCLSAHCASTAKAHLLVVLTVVLILGGTWLLDFATSRRQWDSALGEAEASLPQVVLEVVNPVQTWRSLTFGRGYESPDGGRALRADRHPPRALAGVGLYAALAALLALAAVGRFARDTGQGRQQ
ncbi:MAG: ABC transporter permease [Gemmataceae bacterium]